MVIQRATETEAVFAETVDRRDRPIEVPGFDMAVDGILAIRSGTPFEILLVINISSSQKRSIPARAVSLDIGELQT
jgi:hypothetical protein